jgi:uncharacterized membrane protein YfcA
MALAALDWDPESPRMIDLPDASTFAAVLSERRFMLAAAIAAIAGAARGFAGFGSALIYVPLISAVYEPKIAAVSLLLIDSATGVPVGVRAFPQCDWRDVGPIVAAALVLLPLGTFLLLVVDPTEMRWFIGVFVLFALPLLAGGWRYHGKPKLPISLAVGGLAGLTSGAVQIGGPPVILYWLGGALKAAIVRANMFVFFGALDVAGCINYFVEGLFSRESIALAVLLGIPYTLLFLLGAISFDRAPEKVYRWIAYAMIGFAGIFSLPIFDRLFQY